MDVPERSAMIFLDVIERLQLWSGGDDTLKLNGLHLALIKLVDCHRWHSRERAPWGQLRNYSGTENTKEK